MSDREGMYCERHVKWCADGVCGECKASTKPLPRAPIVLGGAHPVSIRGPNAVLPSLDCNHANGYCKDTAHKYELPEDSLAVLARDIEQRADDTEARMGIVLGILNRAFPEE